MSRSAASFRIDRDRLAAGDLRGAAERCVVELPVQPGGRLAGDQMKRKALGAGRSQPLRRLQPLWVSGAVVIAEGSNPGREDLDPPRWRFQRIALRIRPEFAQQHRLRGGCRKLEPALLPEAVEIRPLDGLIERLLARQVVEVAQPFHLAPTLGEGLVDPEVPGERGEDVVIVARLGEGIHDPPRGDQEGVAGGTADIVALERRRCRQDDVGVLGERVPPDLMNDHRLGLAPCGEQLVDVLMMMEGIAACPIDQLYVGISQPPAVVIERLPRVEQHVGDPGDGNDVLDRVSALGQGGAKESSAAGLPMRLVPA